MRRPSSIRLNTTLQSPLDSLEDVIKGKIAVIKHCDDGTTKIETPEKGAEFEVYLKAAGSYEMPRETERDILVCDENGFAETKDLPYGEYTVNADQGLGGRNCLRRLRYSSVRTDRLSFSSSITQPLRHSLKLLKRTPKRVKLSLPPALASRCVTPTIGRIYRAAYQLPDACGHRHLLHRCNGQRSRCPKSFLTAIMRSSSSVRLPGYVLDSPAPIAFKVDRRRKPVIGVEKFNMPQKGIVNILKKSGKVFFSAVESGRRVQLCFLRIKTSQGQPGKSPPPRTLSRRTAHCATPKEWSLIP